MIPDLPQPPENLVDWLVLFGLFGTVIAAARKWLVGPLLDEMKQHSAEHEEARRVRELVQKQLAPNGSDRELPWDERDKPLRDLAIKGLLAVRKVDARMADHAAFTARTLALLNEDRVARGLPPVPGEDG